MDLTFTSTSESLDIVDADVSDSDTLTLSSRTIEIIAISSFWLTVALLILIIYLGRMLSKGNESEPLPRDLKCVHVSQV